ncbi:MAG: hypothetical protein ABR915_11365 [Thermoguttaceae bacterium]
MNTRPPRDHRQLRLRIARLRRRVDRRLQAVGNQGRELVSWRTLVRRYPGYAAMAAAGAGLCLSAALRRGRLVRWLGGRLVREAIDRVAGQLWQDVRTIWDEVGDPPGDRGPSKGGGRAST